MSNKTHAISMSNAHRNLHAGTLLRPWFAYPVIDVVVAFGVALVCKPLPFESRAAATTAACLALCAGLVALCSTRLLQRPMRGFPNGFNASTRQRFSLIAAQSTVVALAALVCAVALGTPQATLFVFVAALAGSSRSSVLTLWIGRISRTKP